MEGLQSKNVIRVRQHLHQDKQKTHLQGRKTEENPGNKKTERETTKECTPAGDTAGNVANLEYRTRMQKEALIRTRVTNH